MNYNIRAITFEEILPVWRDLLWPGRKSKIETHSSIVFDSNPYIYDLSYFNNSVDFIGLFVNDCLAGVNSGHLTGESYRSRGVYVMPEYRGNHFGSLLLSETISYSKKAGASFCWSMPRYTSIAAYNRAGFSEYGDWFKTETSDKNIYVIAQN